MSKQERKKNINEFVDKGEFIFISVDKDSLDVYITSTINPMLHDADKLNSFHKKLQNALSDKKNYYECALIVSFLKGSLAINENYNEEVKAIFAEDFWEEVSHD